MSTAKSTSATPERGVNLDAGQAPTGQARLFTCLSQGTRLSFRTSFASIARRYGPLAGVPTLQDAVNSTSPSVSMINSAA